jgi:hypothetical protein
LASEQKVQPFLNKTFIYIIFYEGEQFVKCSVCQNLTIYLLAMFSHGKSKGAKLIKNLSPFYFLYLKKVNYKYPASDFSFLSGQGQIFSLLAYFSNSLPRLVALFGEVSKHY